MAAKTAPPAEEKIAPRGNKNLDLALQQIAKDYGEGAIMRLGDKTSMDVESIPTGNILIDRALGVGGFPRGRVVEVFGPAVNRKRATNLPLCFQLLGAAATPPTEQDTSGTSNASDLWLCPKCAGPMVVVERLTAAEMQLRSPPVVAAAA